MSSEFYGGSLSHFGVDFIFQLVKLISEDDRCKVENDFNHTFPTHIQNVGDISTKLTAVQGCGDFQEVLNLTESNGVSTRQVFLFMVLMCWYDEFGKRELQSSLILSNLERYASSFMKYGIPFSLMLYGLSDDGVSDDANVSLLPFLEMS